MRLMLASTATLFTLAACAPSRPPDVAAAQCPAISMASQQAAGSDAINQFFGAELTRRFGSRSIYLNAEQTTDDAGNLMVTYRRIGPEKFAMPEPGKGGELQILLEKCTSKVLRTRKLAELEIAPLALPANDPAQ